MDFLNRLYTIFLDWCFPPVCLLCGELLPLEKSGRELCENCAGDMPYIKTPICPNCGRATDKDEICIYCNKRNFNFKRGVSVFAYSDARFAIKHFKFKGCKHDAVGLGIIMSNYIKTYRPDILADATLIIPVPSHNKRQKSRGFNQSALLAYEISKNCNLPCLLDSLVRVKNTIPQSRLNETQRLENCRDAFAVNNPQGVTNQVILLIDDIFTTGATLNSCAGVLYEAGAKEVIPFCLSIVVLEQEYAAEKL